MTTEEKEKNNTLTIILGVVLVLILALGAYFLLTNGNATEEEPTLPPVTLPQPPEGVPYVTANTGVNVRTGPSTSFDSYGVAPSGASAEAIGISEDSAWWVVKVPAKYSSSGQGWVSGEYVTATDTDGLPVVPSPELPPEIPVPTPDPNAATVTALDMVNVRSGPGESYASYGLAHTGTVGEVLGVSEDDAWWVVKVPAEYSPSSQGWVSADWVSFSNPNNVEIPVIPAP